MLGSVLARGGEGTIYHVAGRADLAAKIYNTLPDFERVAKLEAMIASRAVRDCAWPKDLLVNPMGQIIGFLMPKVAGRKEIHVLCNNAARKQTFPDRGYDFLVAVAANLARAVANVHEAGHVIGDVNERFALVAEDATVVLIDCDSFQITAGGRVFTCDVGSSLFQPPELQRAHSFKRLERTRNHDAFGLAVLIFQLLFLGRHPFAGMPRNQAHLTIEAAISQYLFAYDRATQHVLAPPPNTLALSDVGETIATFFRRSFGRQGENEGRAKAEAWVRELELFRQRLRPCPRNPLHAHLGQSCPICTIEDATGTFLFPPPPAKAFDWLAPAQALWREIERIGAEMKPEAAPKPGDFLVPPPVARAEPNWRRIGILAVSVGLGAPGVWGSPLVAAFLGRPDEGLFVLLLTVALVAFGLFALTKEPLEVRRRRQELSKALARYQETTDRWSRDQSWTTLQDEKDRLKWVYFELTDQLPRRRDAERARLQASAKQAALHRFLEQFELQPGMVRGVGPERLKTLNSYGIETAADIEPAKVRRVPGIGSKLERDLMQWRRDKERHFQAPPCVDPNPAEIAKVEAQLVTQARQLLSKLAAGKERLQDLARQAASEQARLLAEISDAAKAVAQARAALDAVTRRR